MIKFESQYNDASCKVQMDLSSDATLSEVLEAFESFLKATGYVFSGQIDIVENEYEKES
jgi:hypothetical protein